MFFIFFCGFSFFIFLFIIIIKIILWLRCLPLHFTLHHHHILLHYCSLLLMLLSVMWRRRKDDPYEKKVKTTLFIIIIITINIVLLLAQSFVMLLGILLNKKYALHTARQGIELQSVVWPVILCCGDITTCNNKCDTLVLLCTVPFCSFSLHHVIFPLVKLNSTRTSSNSLDLMLLTCVVCMLNKHFAASSRLLLRTSEQRNTLVTQWGRERGSKAVIKRNQTWKKLAIVIKKCDKYTLIIL